jgi:hypothetical protein
VRRQLICRQSFGDSRILLKELRQAFVEKRFDSAFDIRIELAFGLSLELRLRQFDGDNGNQAFAHVVACQRRLKAFGEAGRLRVGIDGAREGRAETG